MKMGLVYFVMSSQCFIHVRNKHEQREIAFFFIECLICTLLLDVHNNKSDLENGIALHRIPFFKQIIMAQSE